MQIRGGVGIDLHEQALRSGHGGKDCGQPVDVDRGVPGEQDPDLAGSEPCEEFGKGGAVAVVEGGVHDQVLDRPCHLRGELVEERGVEVVHDGACCLGVFGKPGAAVPDAVQQLGGRRVESAAVHKTVEHGAESCEFG
ncbi:hypothetical protein [Rhodococcus ruber]|uniref:hypothetical protein n=1 Tax=Rhodococcus ruber TaxID=1830 RepID=UPI001269678D|nr:hypothetical protein [Rhodococcus ruber]